VIEATANRYDATAVKIRDMNGGTNVTELRYPCLLSNPLKGEEFVRFSKY
jgi:hypothetical protein